MLSESSHPSLAPRSWGLDETHLDPHHHRHNDEIHLDAEDPISSVHHMAPSYRVHLLQVCKWCQLQWKWWQLWWPRTGMIKMTTEIGMSIPILLRQFVCSNDKGTVAMVMAIQWHWQRSRRRSWQFEVKNTVMKKLKSIMANQIFALLEFPGWALAAGSNGGWQVAEMGVNYSWGFGGIGVASRVKRGSSRQVPSQDKRALGIYFTGGWGRTENN